MPWGNDAPREMSLTSADALASQVGEPRKPTRYAVCTSFKYTLPDPKRSVRNDTPMLSPIRPRLDER